MSTETSPDKIQLHVFIDGSPARRELAETTQALVKLKEEQKALRTEYRKLTDEQKAARKAGNSEEVKRLSIALENNRTAYRNVTTAMGENNAKQNELRKGMTVMEMGLTELIKKKQALTAEWKAGLGSGEALRTNARELAEVEARIQALGTAQGRAMMLWEEDRVGIDLNRMSLEQLNMEMKRAQTLRETAQPGADYDKANADLTTVKDRVEQMTNANRIAAEQWKALRASMHIDDMSKDQLKLEKQALEELQAPLARSSAEYAKLDREIEAVDKALADSRSGTSRHAAEWEKMRKSIKLTDMTMEQLEMESKRLKSVLDTTKPNTDQWKSFRHELNGVEARMKTVSTGLGPFAQGWKMVKANVLSAGAVLGGMFAGGAIMNGFNSMVTGAAELSDAISDVKKTTGLSTPVVKELAQELGKLDTRTSRAELLMLARDAGKLGITAKEDVLAFVKAGNQINVALGEDLGADAIKNIGKLVDLFKLKEKFGLEESMLKVGSAINELGMASTASEGYMVEFMKRMGGISPLAGITIQQTLALGATLDALGQTSEVSSTALSKLFLKMAGDAQNYAAIAGVSVEEFKRMMTQDALGAFIAVLEGSKKTEGGLIQLTETLGDMGVDGSRAAGVFGVLANNTDLLHKQMDLANKSFEEGTSITAEYTEKNTNLAAELAKLGKEFNRLFANTTMIGWISNLVSVTKSAVSWLQRHKDAILFIMKVLANAAVAWVTYRIVVAASSKETKLAMFLTRAYATIKALLTGQIRLATVAQKAFNLAVKSNPIALIVSLLATAVAMYVSFADEVENATEKQGKLNETMQETKRIAEEMRNLTRGTEILGKMDREQVLAHKRALEEQLQNQSDVSAKSLAQEEAATKALITLQKERAGELARLNKLSQTAATAEERKNARLAALGMFGEVKDLNDRVLISKKKLNLAISSEDANANQVALKAQIAAAEKRLDELGLASEEELRTVKWYNDEIARLKEKQDLSTNPVEHNAIAKQITELETARDKITGEHAKKRRDKAVEDLNKLQEEYAQYQAQLRVNTLDADAKELEELDLKHAEELSKVREQQKKLIAAKLITPEQAATDLNTAGTQNKDDRDKLIKEQNDRRFKAMEEANKRITDLLGSSNNDFMQAELHRVEVAQQEQERLGFSVVDQEEEKRAILLRIYEQNAKDALLAETEKWDDVLEEARKRLEEYDEALAKNPLDATDEDLRVREDLADGIIDLERSKNQMIENINADRREHEEAAEKQHGRRMRMEAIRKLQIIASLANASADMMAGIEQYAAVNEQIAEQRADRDGVRTAEEIANIERLKKQRRTAAITALAVQGAAAIASGVASAMADPVWYVAVAKAAATVGIVMGLISQARSLMNTDTSGASSTARASGSLNDVPLGAKGGVLTGSSHDAGGLAVTDNRTGKQVAELEGGEAYAVLSKKFVAKNADLLPALFQASRTGTRFTPFDREVAIPNPKRVSQGMRVVHMADGGVIYRSKYDTFAGLNRPSMVTSGNTGNDIVGLFNSSAGFRAQGGNSEMAQLLELNRALLSELRNNTAAAEAFPTNLKATTSLREGERRKSEYEHIQHLSKARKSA